MRLEESFRKLKVHELRVQERNSRDEEQALLSRAFNKSKKDQKGGDEKRPRGRQFHMVSCQNKVQTYQFDEYISN